MVTSLADWRSRVLTEVDATADELAALVGGLVRIPSVTGTDAEHDLVDHLAKRLLTDGLEVDHWPIDLATAYADVGFPGTEAPRAEAWGLVGRLPGRGDGPSLMLSSHVDVVPPGDLRSWARPDPFDGAVRDGRVHGRGACDMKGGLAATLIAVRALAHTGAPLRGDLLIAGVEGEEDGGLGTFATLARGWRADACVIPEPTDLGLVPANAGALTFRLEVAGRAVHASRRTLGVSALDKLWPVLGALAALEAHRNADVDPLMRRWPIAYPISVGVVRTGDWASTVPDLLVAEGRMGVALGELVEDARAALESAVALACAQDPWLREHPVRVQWWGGQFAPGRLPPGTRLLAAVQRAHACVGGGPQEVYGVPYGSDLRLMVGAGVPTVHYGPGDGGLAHGPDESVPLAEVLTCARTLAVLALEHCGT
jgi:acetylornithine deacetylase